MCFSRYYSDALCHFQMMVSQSLKKKLTSYLITNTFKNKFFDGSLGINSMINAEPSSVLKLLFSTVFQPVFPTDSKRIR